MAYVRSTRRDRVVAAGGAGAGVALLALGLIHGLVGRFVPPDARTLQMITVAMPPPPPEERVTPAPQKNSRPEGEAAPPNLEAKPTEIVAPLPPLPLPPPPLPAAPVAGPGSEARSGAAETPGPGTGAGGEGQGRGSGGSGDGTGGGGGDGTPPVRIAGRLKDSDYPRGALEAGVGGTVEVRYLVDEKGRVEDCEVARSSGNAEIDQTTCRLIRQRFRFRPSRDADGKPVPAYVLEFHSWIMRIMPPEERQRRR